MIQNVYLTVVLYTSLSVLIDLFFFSFLLHSLLIGTKCQNVHGTPISECFANAYMSVRTDCKSDQSDDRRLLYQINHL